MSTPYTNIYTRAISELEDPAISSAYVTSPLSFFKIMYNYFNNAIPLFTIPKSVQLKLIDATKPSGKTELFSGNGIITVFPLTSTPTVNAYFNYLVNGVSVIGTYNTVGNSVTITPAPPIGTEDVSIEWYDTGNFNQTLLAREERILSFLLVQCWSEKEKNFLLDIRRLLSDTDFKLSAESTTMREKGNWYNSIRENAESEMKKYSWDVYTDSMNQKYGLS